MKTIKGEENTSKRSLQTMVHHLPVMSDQHRVLSWNGWTQALQILLLACRKKEESVRADLHVHLPHRLATHQPLLQLPVRHQIPQFKKPFLYTKLPSHRAIVTDLPAEKSERANISGQTYIIIVFVTLVIVFSRVFFQLLHIHTWLLLLL